MCSLPEIAYYARMANAKEKLEKNEVLIACRSGKLICRRCTRSRGAEIPKAALCIAHCTVQCTMYIVHIVQGSAKSLGQLLCVWLAFSHIFRTTSAWAI